MSVFIFTADAPHNSQSEENISCGLTEFIVINLHRLGLPITNPRSENILWSLIVNYFVMSNNNTTSDNVSPKIINILWSKLLALILEDEQIKVFEKVAVRTGSSSVDKFVNAVRRSMKVEVKPMSEDGMVTHCRVVTSVRRLKDLILDGLDNKLIAKSRRRTPSKEPELEFLGEVLAAETDYIFSFTHNAKDNSILLIRNNNKHWAGKSSWLENLIFRSISDINKEN